MSTIYFVALIIRSEEFASDEYERMILGGFPTLPHRLAGKEKPTLLCKSWRSTPSKSFPCCIRGVNDSSCPSVLTRQGAQNPPTPASLFMVA